MLADLLNHDSVTETVEIAGPIGVMALHGGLEADTETIAARIAARSGASRYTVTQGPDLRWHVPSIAYDPAESAALTEFLTHVRAVVSLHGFGRAHLRHTVLVGGRNRDLGEEVADALRRRTELTVLDGDDVPEGLRGTHPANPVNLAERAGVQLELSPGCRAEPHVDRLIDTVSAVIDRHQRSLCERPDC